MDQDAAVRAFCTRMPKPNNLLHARAHRQVIRDFGRFPYRNDAVGRQSTGKEIAYLELAAIDLPLKIWINSFHIFCGCSIFRYSLTLD